MNRFHLTRHQARPRQHALLALCLAALAMVPALSCAGDTTPLLARELAAEGRYDAAAIEFRRAALAAESDEAAGYYWAAAHAYRRAGRPAQASAMLDRAEDASAALHREATLLRADIAADLHQWHEAEFYLDSDPLQLNPDARVAVARKLAATRLMLDQPDGATQALRAAPRQDPPGASRSTATSPGRINRRVWAGCWACSRAWATPTPVSMRTACAH